MALSNHLYSADLCGPHGSIPRAEFPENACLQACIAAGAFSEGRHVCRQACSFPAPYFLKKGTAWPNPRFTDNSNGTVTDNLTGLIWLKNANVFSGIRTWTSALTACSTLANGAGGLTDGSVAGDWRLPNVKELQSLIDYGRASPALCNAAGTGWWTAGDPFTGVVLSASYYWSGTTYAGNTAGAWVVNLADGDLIMNNKCNSSYVWPVRGGQ